MKKQILLIMGLVLAAGQVLAAEGEWKEKPQETFSDAEANFKLVMQKLLERYLDKKVTKDELYRAATAGMLESLNPGSQSWNKLISPAELKELQSELAGQLVGIGAELKFDEATGHALVMKVQAKSPGEKAGLKKDDQILSVDGKRYKGLPFRDLIAAVRGKPGVPVELKILRDDRIVSLSVKRDAIAWIPVDLQHIDDTTDLLQIGYFNEESPKVVEEKIREVNRRGTKRLIVDLRSNSGGGFAQVIKVGELFLPKDALVAKTRDRIDHVTKYEGARGLLEPGVQLVVLTNKGTYSGAELLAGALRDGRGAKLIGEATSGKWNVQTVENLPNGFAIKYTVETFESPKGLSFQGTGIKPDLEVPLAKDIDVRELASRYDVAKRLSMDAQLKAAYELAKAL